MSEELSQIEISELKARIFDLKNKCGKKRQRLHEQELERLAKKLADYKDDKGKKVKHPFEMGNNFYKFAEEEKFIFDGSKTYQARIKEADYLYRVESAAKFLERLRWLSSRIIKEEGSKDAWDKFCQDFKQALKDEYSNSWLKLESYAVGTYPATDVNNWKFTWWTSFPLCEDLALGARKIGVCTKWLSNYPIVMRVRASSLQNNDLAFVPTVIDAYFSTIFHPVKDQPAPKNGVTIDLSGDPLREGVDEYVIAPFDVRLIEFKPILGFSINYEQMKWIEEDIQNLPILADYYSNLYNSEV